VAPDRNLTFRPLTTADVDEEFIGWYDNRDGHLDGYSGRQSPFDAVTFRKQLVDGRAEGTVFYYLLMSDGKKIGHVRIGPVDLVNRTSDLVCMIGDRSFLGKGLAAAGIRLLTKHAFEVHGIRRLHGGMLVTNVASIKAYTKAGWEIEGVFKDFYWRDGRGVDRVCVCCLPQ